MRLRCPHCRAPIDVVDDDPLTKVSCPSCGSDFNLISGSETDVWRGGHGERIGHFDLIEQLGVGHFGSVWKSRDTTLDRIVAVKVPRTRHLSDAETEQFLREARAAAQLRHPNIVSLHEVGRDNGSVYIVSDLIQGCTLKEWLSAQRLTLREAAELCATVADALQHAHECGVVHRDMKPANILLDFDGKPHVTDFGLAKRESGEITMTVEGQILGTPAYMSPEQARGDAHQADRRSDVYSLGVILFELLTGELPFRGEPRMLIVQILRDEPPSPRKLNSAVPRDLETICLKCLQKNPDRRYQTAEELAADLQRWLDGNPILARPISRTERAIRWCRRKPAIAALLAAVVLVTLLGFAGVTWQWRKAVAAEQQAQQNLEQSETHRKRRDVNFKRAMGAVDKMLTHVGAEQLAEVPEMAPVRKAILEDALAFYKGFLNDDADDPDLRAETARAYMRVGAINWLLEDRQVALEAYSQAIALIERPAAELTLDQRRSMGECYHAKGVLLREEKRSADASKAFAAAARFAREAYKESSSVQDLLELAQSLNRYAGELRTLGLHEKSKQALLEAVALLEPIVGESADSQQSPGTLSLAWFYWQLGHFAASAERWTEAETYMRKELALRRRSANRGGIRFSTSDPFIRHRPDVDHIGSNHANQASNHERLANVLERTGRPAEAKEHRDRARRLRAEAVAMQEAQVAKEPDSRFERELLVKRYQDHVRRLQQDGEIKKAEEYVLKAIGISRDLAAEFPAVQRYRRLFVEVLRDKGSILLDIDGRTDEGAQLLQASFDEWTKLLKPEEYGADYFNDAGRWVRYSHELSVADRTDEAEYILQSLIPILEQWRSEPGNRDDVSRTLADAYHELAALLPTQADHEAAVAYYRKAEPLRVAYLKVHPDDDRMRGQLAWTYANMGRALRAQKLYCEEPHAYLKAIQQSEIRLGKSPQQENLRSFLLACHDRVVSASARCSDVKEQDLREAVVVGKSGSRREPENGTYSRTIGVASYRLGDYEEAADALRRAGSLPESKPAIEQFFLAMALHHLGQADEARRRYAEAVRRMATENPRDDVLRHLHQEAAQLLGGEIEMQFERGLRLQQYFDDAEKGRRLLDTKGREEEGATLVQAAFDGWVEVVGHEIDSLDAAQVSVWGRWGGWAYKLKQADRVDESEHILRTMVPMLEKWREEHSDRDHVNEELGDLYHQLGDVLSHRRGDQEAAVEYYRKAEPLRLAYLKAHPDEDYVRGQLAWTYANMGWALLRQDRHSDAYHALANAIEQSEFLVSKTPQHENHRELLLSRHNTLISVLIRCPDAKEQDLRKAVVAGKSGSDREPVVGTYWRTVGIASYRLGDYEEAADALQKAGSLPENKPAIEQFFLAMAFHHLGKADEARQSFDEAVQYMEEKTPHDNLSKQLRVEAARLLQLSADK